MLEWLILPTLVGVAATIPKKKNERKTIETIFENRRICIKKGDHEQYPKFLSKTVKDSHTTYCYTLPIGIPSDVMEGLETAFAEALNKEIEWEFDGILKIRVFHEKLPTSWNYTDDLISPGTWLVPIGKNHQGILYHDFDKYAHFLIGGVPGFGKTIFTKSIFNTVILNNPHDVDIYVLDLKGGLEFGKFGVFPQVKAVADNVYDAAEVLSEVVEQMKKDEKYFRENGFTNIVDTPIKKRSFIFVDEGAELSPDVKSGEEKQYAKFCQAALSEIARIGRAVGYRLIYSTQYPTREAVPMQVKMNIVSRVSFIAAAQIASRVILDDVGAEDLPSIPGRAIYKVEKNRTIQVPYITDEQIFAMNGANLNESRKTRKVVNDDRHATSDDSKAIGTNP